MRSNTIICKEIRSIHRVCPVYEVYGDTEYDHLHTMTRMVHLRTYGDGVEYVVHAINPYINTEKETKE